MQYEGSVEENTVNVEVLRIKAIDMDLIHTDNWLAVFNIISGNEAGYFSITTDSQTNEGIIMIQKVRECSFIFHGTNSEMKRCDRTNNPSCTWFLNLQALDYEELKLVNLEVTVSNKAEYNFGSGSITGGGSATSKSYSVKISVVNQKEGPRFQPSVKVVTISEDQTSINLNKIITRYAAIDTDTQQTITNVRYCPIMKDVTKLQLYGCIAGVFVLTSIVCHAHRYAKIRDDDNWLIVDEKTADIRLIKLPDRESKYLINGTYYAKIICITNGEFWI